jgi:hypothetical protein
LVDKHFSMLYNEVFALKEKHGDLPAAFLERFADQVRMLTTMMKKKKRKTAENSADEPAQKKRRNVVRLRCVFCCLLELVFERSFFCWLDQVAAVAAVADVAEPVDSAPIVAAVAPVAVAPVAPAKKRVRVRAPRKNNSVAIAAPAVIVSSDSSAVVAEVAVDSPVEAAVEVAAEAAVEVAAEVAEAVEVAAEAVEACDDSMWSWDLKSDSVVHVSDLPLAVCEDSQGVYHLECPSDAQLDFVNVVSQ